MSKSDPYSFIDIIMSAKAVGRELSSAEIEEAIRKLEKAQKTAWKKEEEERIRKEKEEKERQEREERERQKLHVQEVTCMDLPLDWSNFFDSDERTSGVHMESIPDALAIK